MSYSTLMLSSGHQVESIFLNFIHRNPHPPSPLFYRIFPLPQCLPYSEILYTTYLRWSHCPLALDASGHLAVPRGGARPVLPLPDSSASTTAFFGLWHDSESGMFRGSFHMYIEYGRIWSVTRMGITFFQLLFPLLLFFLFLPLSSSLHVSIHIQHIHDDRDALVYFLHRTPPVDSLPIMFQGLDWSPLGT